MRDTLQGTPCWFELWTGDLDAAGGFYASVLGWKTGDSVMPDFDYRLAESEGAMVAGMMPNMAPEGAPNFWMIYISVADCDQAIVQSTELGAAVIKPAEDVPGTGRFALLTDPQGAGFGILQPEDMDAAPKAQPFDQQRAGHVSWIELMSSDPVAGFDFYAALFGWGRGDAIEMGEAGPYQMFTHGEATIGGMMGLGDAPVPNWLAYFSVDDLDLAMTRIREGGGRLQFDDPVEVPGPALIMVAQDPQGAFFALVGPKPDAA